MSKNDPETPRRKPPPPEENLRIFSYSLGIVKVDGKQLKIPIPLTGGHLQKAGQTFHPDNTPRVLIPAIDAMKATMMFNFAAANILSGRNNTPQIHLAFRKKKVLDDWQVTKFNAFLFHILFRFRVGLIFGQIGSSPGKAYMIQIQSKNAKLPASAKQRLLTLSTRFLKHAIQEGVRRDFFSHDKTHPPEWNKNAIARIIKEVKEIYMTSSTKASKK
jgi:hypothetical protein